MNTQEQPAMIESPATVECAYTKALKELERFRLRIEELKPHLDVIEKLREAFPGMDLATSVGYAPHTVQGALLYANDLDDIKQVLPIGAALSAAGYTPKGFDDYPEIKRRTYRYEPGPISLMAFLKWDGTSKCEYRVKGYEQKPVYELVCGEQATEEVKP